MDEQRTAGGSVATARVADRNTPGPGRAAGSSGATVSGDSEAIAVTTAGSPTNRRIRESDERREEREQ